MFWCNFADFRYIFAVWVVLVYFVNILAILIVFYGILADFSCFWCYFDGFV